MTDDHRNSAIDGGKAAEPYILFELAGTTYAVRSRDVQQIDMIEQITPVPNAAPCVEGVVFLRGQVIPVVNLRVRFGLDMIQHDLRTRLIVIRLGERSVGLVVDLAREFVRIPEDAIQPPPETVTGLRGKYLEAIAMLGERLVLVLELDEVLKLADVNVTGTAALEL